MKKPGEGQVLVQVLVMSFLMIFVATLLLRITMHQRTLGGHESGETAGVKSAEAALNAVNDAWSAAGQNCSNGSWTDSGGFVTSVCCDGTPAPCAAPGANAGKCTTGAPPPGCTCTVITYIVDSQANPLQMTDSVTATPPAALGGACSLAVNDTYTY